MKANELKIGNLIQYNEGGQCKVIGIHEFGIDVEFPEETTYIEYDQFSPIPLTEEWLEKFGFVKNKNTFILNKDASVTHEKTGSESGFWYSNDESNARCYRLKKIEFVHELQNLFFSLCGEELNVK